MQHKKEWGAKNMKKKKKDKGRSESEGSCSRYGFANPADLIENNVQGKRTEKIVEDIAGIEEDFQNTVKVDELEKEDHLLKKDCNFENSDNFINIAAKEKRAKEKERENTNKNEKTENIDDKQKGDKSENAKQKVIDEEKCLGDVDKNVMHEKGNDKSEADASSKELNRHKGERDMEEKLNEDGNIIAAFDYKSRKAGINASAISALGNFK